MLTPLHKTPSIHLGGVQARAQLCTAFQGVLPGAGLTASLGEGQPWGILW